MQWNCPHCGTKLSVGDEAFGSGWSFSRCYKCAGFALVRRAEINVIKVDKAPPGENIILPEASPSPRDSNVNGLISENATRNLSKRLTNEISPPPMSRSQLSSQSTHTASNTLAGTPPPAPAAASFGGVQGKSEITLPAPLPEIIPQRRKLSLPLGIGAASVLAVVSGFYFYLQAQTLWEKARRPLPELMSKGNERLGFSINPGESQKLNVQDSSQGNAQSNTQGNTLDSGANPTPSSQNSSAPQDNSGNPEKNLSPQAKAGATRSGPEASPFDTRPDTRPVTLASNSVANANPNSAQGSNDKYITDQIQETATAPVKNPDLASTPDSTDPRLMVEVRAHRVSVHTGPGLQFPVVGTVNGKQHYAVLDWSDRWFKLKLKNPQGRQLAANTTGWVRNDLVKVIPERPSAVRPASP